MSGMEVVLPPFVYQDNWANIDIAFNRIQNFIGMGYLIEVNKLSFIPLLEFQISFANNFEVNIDPNENAVNKPTGQVVDPNFEVGFNEYGARVSVEFGYKLLNNLKLTLTPGFIYGEMELTVQDSPQFSGGDNITNGWKLGLVSSIFLEVIDQSDK